MEFFDYFDAKYVISLPARKDRLNRLKRQLGRYGCDLASVVVFPGVVCTQDNGFPSLGARGCFEAHLGVFRDARRRNAKNILVMEDDLVFQKNLVCFQQKIIRELESKIWDMAYFGNKVVFSKPAKEIMRRCPEDAKIMCAHFYAIRGEALGRMIGFLEALMQRPPGSSEGGPMHLDGAFAWFRKKNSDGVTLVSSPVLGIQGSSRSDILTKKLDTLPLVSGLLFLARQIKDKLWYRV